MKTLEKFQNASSPSLPVHGILTRRLACELLEGFRKMEPVVEAEHLSQFLVGEPVAGQEMSCALDAPRLGVAGRWLACDIGEVREPLAGRRSPRSASDFKLRQYVEPAK